MIGVGGRTTAAPRPILGAGRQEGILDHPPLPTAPAPPSPPAGACRPAGRPRARLGGWAGSRGGGEAPLDPKVHFGSKSDFLLQKCILEPKIDFWVKK